MACFDSCEKKFHNEYIHGLTRSAKSPDLHAGGVFASAIEAAGRALWIDGADLDTALQAATRKAIKEWGYYDPPEGHVKSFLNMMGALYSYFEEYPPHSDPIKPYMRGATDGEEPAIEYTFALPTDVPHPVSGDPILYCGRFDLLGVLQSKLFIVDEKTTKNFSYNWAYQWGMRGQFLGYCWACQQHGLPVSDALIRGVAIQKTQYKHMQAIVGYQQWQIDRWHENMIKRLHRMATSFALDDWEYSYGDGCSSYSGCQFTDLCTSPRPENWLGDYEERRWNPLAKDPALVVDSEEEVALTSRLDLQQLG